MVLTKQYEITLESGLFAQENLTLANNEKSEDLWIANNLCDFFIKIDLSVERSFLFLESEIIISQLNINLKG